MESAIMSPKKYVQGDELLKKIGSYTKKKSLIIIDKFIFDLVENDIIKSYQKENIEVFFEIFSGECSKEEINRIKKINEEINSSMIVGVGGGKTLDCAKAVAHYLNLPVTIVPTIASTDAPCSALSVIYSSTGIFEEYLILPSNPDLVLMDVTVISKAPPRLLVAGMGDALATFFEVRANVRSNSKTLAGGIPSLTAYALSELCLKTLLEDGELALASAKSKTTTKYLNNVIEANTYLSGIGFESGGLAAAHAIHNGLTILEECHHLYHGEKVAFGTIVQLILEKAPKKELKKIIEFCTKVGLPTSLKELGVKEIDENKILEVAKLACAPGETIHNMPFEITPEILKNAIVSTNYISDMIRME